MIGMRVVEPEQIPTGGGSSLFGLLVVARTHQEAAAGSFFRGVRKRHRRADDAVGAQHRAAAFVRERLASVRADRVGHAGLERQRAGHQFTPPTNEPSGGSSQKRSDRYFSPPSQKIITTTPESRREATLRPTESAAP